LAAGLSQVRAMIPKASPRYQSTKEALLISRNSNRHLPHHRHYSHGPLLPQIYFCSPFFFPFPLLHASLHQKFPNLSTKAESSIPPPIYLAAYRSISFCRYSPTAGGLSFGVAKHLLRVGKLSAPRCQVWRGGRKTYLKYECARKVSFAQFSKVS
jgi:hypothetical protein